MKKKRRVAAARRRINELVSDALEEIIVNRGIDLRDLPRLTPAQQALVDDAKHDEFARKLTGIDSADRKGKRSK